MDNASKPPPDWDNSDQWNAFQWEEALKHSDHLAARYFRMLQRFGDLPDAEEVIAATLGQEQFPAADEGDLYTFESDDEWDALDDEDDELDDESGEIPPPGGDGNEGEMPPRPGEALYFEATNEYRQARQVALGWCNILSSVLHQEDRFWGLTVLFHLGRVLSYLALGIGDGTYDRPAASFAFAKRALSEINLVLGQVNEQCTAQPRYANVLAYIREHLLQLQEAVEDYLVECRRRAALGPDGGGSPPGNANSDRN